MKENFDYELEDGNATKVKLSYYAVITWWTNWKLEKSKNLFDRHVKTEVYEEFK